jgi:hypothetical protein
MYSKFGVGRGEKLSIDLWKVGISDVVAFLLGTSYGER